MFAQQSTLLKAIPEVRDVIAKYEWKTEPADWLDTTEAKSKDFYVPVPLVGGFSAGKSSLINALLGQKLLSIEITPETAVAAEIHYATEASFCVVGVNGQRIPISKDQLQDTDYLAQVLPKGGWLDIALPLAILEKFPHLRIVDMPGWDSGIETHSQAIDNYAWRSLAYGVVVSAEEGNLRDSLRRALKELAGKDMPVFAVITKIDKKSIADAKSVVEQVKREITATMGQAPLMMAMTSSANKSKGADVQEFIQALSLIEGKTEDLYTQKVVDPFNHKLNNFKDHLDKLLNKDDLDSEKIKAEREHQEAEITRFHQKLKDETTSLDDRLGSVLSKIMQHVEQSLSDEFEYLVDLASSGSDLNNPIGAIFRTAVEEGIRNEFEPEIARYLEKISDGLPEEFSVQLNQNFNFQTSSASGDESGLSITPILASVMPFLKFIPKLNVLGPIITMAAGLLEKFFQSKAKKEAEERAQQEAIEQQIRSQVIPQTLREGKKVLKPLLQQHIEQAKQAVVRNVEAQRASNEAALQELQKRLEAGQVAFAKACEQYRADRLIIEGVQARLQAA